MKKNYTNPEPKPEDRSAYSRSYSAPEVIYETDLETKAGSPLSNPDPGLSLPGFDETEK